MAKTLDARCRPSKDAGALGSSWINEHYTASQRHEDHKGLPEVETPIVAAPRKPYKDPLKFRVVESADIRAARARLRLNADFKAVVDARDAAHRSDLDMVVPRRSCPTPVISAEGAAWSVDYLAEKERHAVWLAKEKADMALRRLMRARRS